MKTIALTSYDTLTSAVAAAQMDLRYNPRTAREDIALIEKDSAFRGAYVGEGDVYFVWEWKDCGRMFNKFDPFCGVLSSSDLNVGVISEGMITITDARVAKRDLNVRKKLCSTSESIVLV